MGVTGLWTVVHPSARPTNLTTLHRKRLAVDASIWIYQFLKAVRDKEGNALRNSHVVGFFRRICKLLYHGIKPVFVFDGGAPVLKRQTISNRKSRREGRREDAVRTAGKMLAVQMQRRAEEEEQKRKDRESGRAREEEKLPADQELVYVDELGMSSKERQQNRTFRKKDAYHLPDLDVSLEGMGAPNDPRIMSHEELEEYARQFHSGEDINFYDFSKIDFESPFFQSLPPSDRYNILNAARLRSRLRMGYSKEQLDGMFPDRMAFSKFQIERVRERNELTQRLMHINGMNESDFLSQGARIAGEKGREYVLVKNDGVEGGWALGVVSNKNEGQKDQPIDVDTYGQKPKEEIDEDEWEDEAGFEDVPIEGLNRIPKTWARKGEEVDYNPDYHDRVEQIARKRRAVYEARKQKAKHDGSSKGGAVSEVVEDPDALFIPESTASVRHEKDDDMDELFEDVDIGQGHSDDEDLQNAIAMSLDKSNYQDEEEGGFINTTFTQGNARAGRDMAHQINERAEQPAMARAANLDQRSEGEDELDLQAALAESRKSKYRPNNGQLRSPGRNNISSNNGLAKPFDGPLPFESLNLGQSLLGKKKSDKIEENQAGGFEKSQGTKKSEAQPMPPWFYSEAPTLDTVREPALQNEEDDEVLTNQFTETRARIRRNETREIIDVDAPSKQEKKPIDLEANDDLNIENEDADSSGKDGLVVVDSELRMDDLADLVRAEPPTTRTPNHQPEPPKEQVAGAASESDEDVNWSETDEEELVEREKSRAKPPGGHFQPAKTTSKSPEFENVGLLDSSKSMSPDQQREDDVDDNEEFEDIDTTKPPTLAPQKSTAISMDAEQRARAEQLLIPDDSDFEVEEEARNDDQNISPVDKLTTADDRYFDESDDEIMRNLAIEAEEHARFVSTLNNSVDVPAQSHLPVDYEAELRQLRNQQKRDRRDADEVTQTMIHECQLLLAHFGLPYVTAPMEAEAQCAELVRLGLVDGIITDDSDVFLFGGTRIYKNMFNAAKFVECYLTSDLEREYALSRDKLISFAHLLGSDYTEGIPGVGPVTALEILTEFSDEGLEGFREWWSTAQFTDPKHIPPDQSHPAFLKKYRRQLTKLFLPPHFPDRRVDAAYLHPEVDSDPEQFQWGVPDLGALRSFLMSTIGWSQERMDEILVPVIRDMNKRETEGTQSNIPRFFGGGVGVGANPNPSSRTKGTANRGLAADNDRANGRTGDEREVFAPRVRESDRMSRAFGRLRGEAERKRKRDGTDKGSDHQANVAVAEGNGIVGTENGEARKTDGAHKKGKRTLKKKRKGRKRKMTSLDEEDDDGDDGIYN